MSKKTDNNVDQKQTLDMLTPEQIREVAEKYAAEQARIKDAARKEKRRERQRIYDAKRKASGKSLTVRYKDAAIVERVKTMLVGLDAYAKTRGTTTLAEVERLITLFQKPATVTPAASQQMAKPTDTDQAQGQPQATQTPAKPQVGDQSPK